MRPDQPLVSRRLRPRCAAGVDVYAVPPSYRTPHEARASRLSFLGNLRPRRKMLEYRPPRQAIEQNATEELRVPTLYFLHFRCKRSRKFHPEFDGARIPHRICLRPVKRLDKTGASARRVGAASSSAIQIPIDEAKLGSTGAYVKHIRKGRAGNRLDVSYWPTTTCETEHRPKKAESGDCAAGAAGRGARPKCHAREQLAGVNVGFPDAADLPVNK